MSQVEIDTYSFHFRSFYDKWLTFTVTEERPPKIVSMNHARTKSFFLSTIFSQEGQRLIKGIVGNLNVFLDSRIMLYDCVFTTSKTTCNLPVKAKFHDF